MGLQPRSYLTFLNPQNRSGWSKMGCLSSLLSGLAGLLSGIFMLKVFIMVMISFAGMHIN